MNKVYRSVWSASRQCFVVAAETVRAKGKPSSSSVAALASVSMVALLGLSQPAAAQLVCDVNIAAISACELDTGQDAIIQSGGSITINSLEAANGAVTVNANQDAEFVTNRGTLAASEGKAGLALDNNSTLQGLFNQNTISVNDVNSSGIVISSGANLASITNEIQLFGAATSATIESANHYGIEVLGTIGTLTNNNLGGFASTIEGTRGIQVLNGGRIDTISNSGTIRSNLATGGVAIGLSGSGSIGTLTNTNEIIANGANSDAIRLEGTSAITTLNNSGTINGGRSGIQLVSIVPDNPSIVTLQNSGTIQGGTFSISTAPGGIQNIEILGNDTARFIGQVQAPDALMLVSSGTTYTLRTTDIFQVNTFENRGIVKLESGPLGQSAAITGNYVQDANGVLLIHVTDDNTYGQLSVDGNVTLPSNAKFDVKVDNANYSFTSSALTGVVSVTNGTISWDETYVIDDNAVLFDFKPVLNGSSIDLSIMAANTSDTGSSSTSARNAVSLRGNTVASGAAAVIDSLVDKVVETQKPLDSSELNTLVSLNTDQDLASVIESTLPVMQGAAPRINLGTQVNMAQSIQSRQQGTLGLAAGDAFVDQHLWIKPFGSWGDQNNRNGAQGYDSETYGVVVGVDAEISPNYRVGASFGYANSSADSNNALNSIDVDSYLISVYGTANLSDNTSVNWQAGYSHHDNEGSRTIPLVSSVAKSDYSSQGWQLGVGLDHSIELSETVTFIPGVRLDYDRIKDKAYTETGAGGLSLDVDSNSTEQLVLGLNSRFQFDLTETSSINADLGVGHDFNAKQNSITSAYSGGGAAFTTQGIKPSKTLWNAGLGYVNQAANGTEITARADVQQRTSGQQDASASLTFRWKF